MMFRDKQGRHILLNYQFRQFVAQPDGQLKEQALSPALLKSTDRPPFEIDIFDGNGHPTFRLRPDIGSARRVANSMSWADFDRPSTDLPLFSDLLARRPGQFQDAGAFPLKEIGSGLPTDDNLSIATYPGTNPAIKK